mmetsp:Transcript_13987/g.32584  ORF Transcript_13987/g.32584 Transcript_13987/m.32584 type:complete len:223 (+) Transcript_13987:1082-1750(+)
MPRGLPRQRARLPARGGRGAQPLGQRRRQDDALPGQLPPPAPRRDPEPHGGCGARRARDGVARRHGAPATNQLRADRRAQRNPADHALHAPLSQGGGGAARVLPDGAQPGRPVPRADGSVAGGEHGGTSESGGQGAGIRRRRVRCPARPEARGDHGHHERRRTDPGRRGGVRCAQVGVQSRVRRRRREHRGQDVRGGAEPGRARLQHVTADARRENERSGGA